MRYFKPHETVSGLINKIDLERIWQWLPAMKHQILFNRLRMMDILHNTKGKYLSLDHSYRYHVSTWNEMVPRFVQNLIVGFCNGESRSCNYYTEATIGSMSGLKVKRASHFLRSIPHFHPSKVLISIGFKCKIKNKNLFNILNIIENIS